MPPRSPQLSSFETSHPRALFLHNKESGVDTEVAQGLERVLRMRARDPVRERSPRPARAGWRRPPVSRPAPPCPSGFTGSTFRVIGLVFRYCCDKLGQL